MATGDIIVNFGMLRSAAEDIRSTVSTMNRELDDLKQSLQPMLATWDGEAQQAYHVRQAQWDAAATDLNTLLSQIQNAVTRSAEIMEARERGNLARFES